MKNAKLGNSLRIFIASAAVFCMAASLAAVVEVDFAKDAGPVKPMHGVGQPPLIGAPQNYSMMHYLKEAGVPYSRLHDVGGAYGRNMFVDIPNLFRNFDANENDPANYDFKFTDTLLNALVENGVEPVFRLGVTIENYVTIRSYRIDPPKDFAKWARICEHVIRHYTEGWADGFHHKITYWEIWNEPENHPEPEKNPMWKGDFASYCNFYEVASKHLKKRFPRLKIGGYGSCGFYAAAGSAHVKAANSSPRMGHFVDCYTNFLAFVKARNCPLDFFSFHTYSGVEEALRQVRWGCRTLKESGFTETETSLNEWLPRPSHERLGTASQAADICAMMIGMQQSELDSALLYDARCGIGNYSPIFNPMTYKPHKAYYALKAFNELYRRGRSAKTNVSEKGVFAMAAGAAEDGAILVANTTGREVPLEIAATGFEAKAAACRITDAQRTWELISLPQALPPESFLLISQKKR